MKTLYDRTINALWKELIDGRDILLMVDNTIYVKTQQWETAEAAHNILLKNHCKYLSKESPVINGNGEVIFHYTKRTYKEWCNN